MLISPAVLFYLMAKNTIYNIKSLILYLIFSDMNHLGEILKYTLPSFVVFLTAFFIIRQFMEREISKQRHELRVKTLDQTLPLRLQAYERVVLLLERISPEALIMRLNLPGMTAKQLHSEMLSTIRAEYDHNLSQQLYVSTESWEIVKKARGNVIRFINTVSERIAPIAPAIELSSKLFEKLMEDDKSPTSDALEFVKKEVRQLF
jgi:hypothetical protein